MLVRVLFVALLDALAVLELLALLALLLRFDGGAGRGLMVRVASASIRTLPKTVVATGVSAETSSEQESDPVGAVSVVVVGGVTVSFFSGMPVAPRSQ